MSQITIFEVPAGADPLNEGANDTWGANGIQIWNRISIDSNTVYFSQNVQANTLLIGNVTINSTAFSVGNVVIMGNTILGSPNSSVNVSANVVIVGNSTVNATVNSTFYSAISNNTLYVGSTSAANVVSNAQLIANLANYALLSGTVFSGQVNTGNLNVIGDATFSGNVTFAGGTKITPVSLVTTDKNLILANGDITGLTANGAGIIITNVAEWIYDNANNAWISNVNIQAVNISGTLTTTSQPNITANNSTNLGGTPASGYQTTAGLAANVATLTSNNSTYLAGYGLGTFQTAAGLSANVLTLTANNTQFVGTVSAANVVSNAQLIANLANYSNTTQITTTLGGYQTTAGLAANVATLAANSALFANNSTYFNGQPAGFYANVTNPTISGNVTIGISGNTIAINATSITIGNSTVNATINSTAFSGFTTSTSENANNSNYLGGVAAASYQLNSTLAANVATLTANNSTNFGGNPVSYFANITSPIHTTSMAVGANVVANTTTLLIGNSTVNVTVNSTIFTGTANNATNLGGTAAAGYQTTAGLSANVATLTSNNTTFFNGQTTAYFANVTSPVITTTMEVGAVGNNVTINTTAVTIGNSTVNSFVNSTFHSATANNTLYLNGTIASSYQLNSTLAANVATLTSNNASYLGTVAAASYVQNTDSRTLSGNLNFSAANTRIANLNVGQVIANGVLGTATQVLTSNATGGVYWATGGGGSFDATAQYTFTNTLVFSNSVAFNGTNTYVANLNSLHIIANGVLGTATQVLQSNSTGGIFWGAASGSFDPTQQYVFTNTETFSNTITFGNSSVNTVIGWNVTDQSVFESIGNVNNFVEIGLYNSNTGNNASADFTINDTGGTAPLNNNYIDVGINGTGFLQSTWTINGPSDAYVYAGNTNLSIGTLAQNYLNFFANGTLANNEVMRITANGVNIGNSNTTVAKLVVGNTTINTTINSTSITANLFISSNGIYVTNTFSGTFVDGVVVDYFQAANGIVRISGGLNDHTIFYNGGVANAMMMKIDGYTGVLSLSMNNPSVSFANATQSMAPVPTLGMAYAISSGFALV